MVKYKLPHISKKMIADIAEEEGMFPKQVENIIMAQFEYMKAMMPKDEALLFKIPYLGKFYVTDERFNARKRRLIEKYGTD